MTTGTAAGRVEPARLGTGARLHALLDISGRVTAGVALVGTLIFVLLQVFTRYVLSDPLAWTDEAARFSLVWLTFLGAAFVMGRRQHIAIDMLATAFGVRVEKVFTLVATLVVLVSSAALVWGGISLAITTASLSSPASGIPIPLVYGAMIVGFALIFTHGLLNTVIDLSAARRESPGTSPELPTEAPN